jgi:hypothetical protein
MTPESRIETRFSKIKPLKFKIIGIKQHVEARCPLLHSQCAASGSPDQRVSGSTKKLPGGVHAVVCEPQWRVGPEEWCSSDVAPFDGRRHHLGSGAGPHVRGRCKLTRADELVLTVIRVHAGSRRWWCVRKRAFFSAN